MPHLGGYKKGETAKLKKAGVKPGTKKAHAFVSNLRNRKKMQTDEGMMFM